MFYFPHKRSQFSCGDELVTKQAHKQECDINFILRQYQRTGIITHVQNARPTYEDLPDQHDYQDALNIQLEAQYAFDALPSKVRDHFMNDPGRFLAAFTDPAQQNYLRENGFLKGAEKPQALPATTLPSPPAEPSPASA